MKIPPMKFMRRDLCFTNRASLKNRRNPDTRLLALGRITQILVISASDFFTEK